MKVILFSFLQRQLLTLIETVWHLCEILFIETLPGTLSHVKCFVVNNLHSLQLYVLLVFTDVYTQGFTLIFQVPRAVMQ